MPCGLPVPFLRPYRCRRNVAYRLCSPLQYLWLRPIYRLDVAMIVSIFGRSGCSGRKAPRRCALWNGTDHLTKINWMEFRCAGDAENKTGTEVHSLLEYKLTGFMLQWQSMFGRITASKGRKQAHGRKEED